MNIKKIEAQKQEVKKLRVAAYCRVSTDSDDQRDSLETQKQHFEAWIRLHSDWEYAGVFYDFGITGTKAEVRDGLRALLYECRIGRIDYVLTKSVSRFARNTVDCLSIVRELLSYGIPIYFEKENLDTGSMESELILSIISSLAQDESESISKNVKWSAQKRMENGSYKIGCVPYGYTKNEHGDMVIAPEEADVIVWRCTTRLHDKEKCRARTVSETLLQEAFLDAVNEMLEDSQVYLKRLKENLETAIHLTNPDSAEALAAKMAALQQELIDHTSRRENYDDLAEEILHMREVQAQTVMDVAAKSEHKKRIRKLRAFIRSHPHGITEFDETLVKHLLERVTVFGGLSGVSVDVGGGGCGGEVNR